MFPCDSVRNPDAHLWSLGGGATSYHVLRPETKSSLPQLSSPLCVLRVLHLHFSLQASTTKHLTVTIPSEYLQQQSTFSFVLRVDTVLGGSSEATVDVYKSSQEVLVSKVCTGG